VGLLEADARRAVADDDRQSYLHDVEAILGMAEQVHSDIALSAHLELNIL